MAAILSGGEWLNMDGSYTKQLMWLRIYTQISIIQHINIDLLCSRKYHMLDITLTPSDKSLMQEV